MKVNGHIQLYPFMRIVVALIIGIVVGDAYNSVEAVVTYGLELRRRLDEDRCRACMDASFVLDRYSCFRHVQYLFLPRWRTC